MGQRRVRALCTAGAAVRWIAPDAPATPSVEVYSDLFKPQHLKGVDLVFACASAAVDAEVVAAARARKLWVGCASDPLSGDFDLPASFYRGGLLISLGTGGRAPAATAVLKNALAARIPEEWAEFVGWIAEARRRLPAGPDRRAQVSALAKGPLLGILAAEGVEAARRFWLDWRRRSLSDRAGPD